MAAEDIYRSLKIKDYLTVGGDFSVNGTTAGVRLTNDLTAGTKVIVTKKIGRVWNDIGKSLTESDNKIANFLKEKTTIWPR